MSDAALRGAVRMLLVDDDDRLRDRLATAFRDRGCEVETARDPASAATLIATQHFDRAVIDLRMPGGNGLSVVKELLAKDPTVEVVVATGYGSIATAVEAIRLGARDYLTKPCHADQILAAFSAEPASNQEAASSQEATSSQEREPSAGEESNQKPRADPADWLNEIPSLARLEREHIERVLRECDGNISKTARVLGLHRRTLQQKLAKFPVAH